MAFKQVRKMSVPREVNQFKIRSRNHNNEIGTETLARIYEGGLHVTQVYVVHGLRRVLC